MKDSAQRSVPELTVLEIVVILTKLHSYTIALSLILEIGTQVL